MHILNNIIKITRPMEAAVQLEKITKSFGQKTAVDSLDLVIPRGGLIGFIGPNGAGKTTTIRMIMSIIFPDTGKLTVLDKQSALEAKDRIGYLPEERGVYRKMKVGAFLRYIALLKGIDKPVLDNRVKEQLESVGLGEVIGKKCEDLSKGMLQKIQFLASIIHEPDLLILDEPFSGLDPVSMRMMRDRIMEEHKRGATILFSTHVMPQAEEICQHVVMIHESYKVLDEPLQTIQRKYETNTILIEPLNPGSDISAVRNLQEVAHVTGTNSGYEIKLTDDSDTGIAIQKITAAITPARIELSRPSLEDIFVRIVAGGGSTPETEKKLRDSLQDPQNVEPAQ